MRLNIIKILTPVILYCFTGSFLEIDLCGHCPQTWHDEYDTYAVGSNANRTERTSPEQFHFEVPLLQATDIVLSAPDPVLLDIQVRDLNGCRFYKIYIKHGALLI